jgi:hypothetical protein
MNLADIRSALLGSAHGSRKSVSVEIGDMTLTVRQPTVRQRSRLLKAAGMFDTSAATSGKKSSGSDMGLMQVLCVIECTYVPDTDEKVFAQTDLDTLLNTPAGGYVDRLSKVAMDLMNVDAAAEGKPLEDVLTDSSSST